MKMTIHSGGFCGLSRDVVFYRIRCNFIPALGWSCTGRTTHRTEGARTKFVNSYFQNKEEVKILEEQLTRFWEIEEFPTSQRAPGDIMSLIDREVHEKTMKGIKYLENSKRYEVPIPWKCEKVNLLTNYAMAMQR